MGQAYPWRRGAGGLLLGWIAILAGGAREAPARVPGEPVRAVSADAAQRVVFTPLADEFGFPRVDCYRAFCKKYTGAFPETSIWLHTTNTTWPPRKKWLVICIDVEGFRPVYRHVMLYTNRTHWSIAVIPQGKWGWIGNWVIDPGPPNERDEPTRLASNASAMTDDGGRVNEAMATVQLRANPGAAPLSETLSLVPTNGPAWSIHSDFFSGPGQYGATETWSSADDPQIERIVQTTVNATPDGFQQVVEVDRGSDGTVDAVTTMTVAQLTPETMTLDLLVHDGKGATLSALHATTTRLGNVDTTITDIDDDGDGDIDIHEEETAILGKGVTLITVSRDLNNDGLVDQTETTGLSDFGEFDGLQLTQIFDGEKQLIEQISVTIDPTDHGYRIETSHDEDGDGSFDSIEVMHGHPAPHELTGLDADAFEIDDDADGIADTTTAIQATKSLCADRYREVVNLDLGADGTVDASSERIVELAPSPRCPGDTDGNGTVDVDDLVAVILDWLTDGSGHNGDVDGSGLVDVDDLVAVLLAWGPCPVCTVDLSAALGPYEGTAVEDPALPPLGGPAETLPPDVAVLRDILLAEGASFDDHVGYVVEFASPTAFSGLAYHPSESEWPFMNTQPFVTYVDAPGPPFAVATWFQETEPGVLTARGWTVSGGVVQDQIDVQVGGICDGVFLASVNGEPCEIQLLGDTSCDVCKAAVIILDTASSFFAGLGCTAGGPAGILWAAIIAAIEAFEGIVDQPQQICEALGYCP